MRDAIAERIARRRREVFVRLDQASRDERAAWAARLAELDLMGRWLLQLLSSGDNPEVTTPPELTALGARSSRWSRG
jgi:hypothetical protein